MRPDAEFPVLAGPRVRLREIRPADAADLFSFRSDPEEQRYNDPPLRTLDEAYALVERLAREYRRYGAIRWGLTLAGADTVVGLLGFNYWNPDHRRAGLGYDLKRSLWGRGLATEAMRAVLDFGFGPMALNRVEAHTAAENVRSIRLLRRLGFWQEGTFHDHYLEDGAFHDVALFVMLQRDRVSQIASDPGS